MCNHWNVEMQISKKKFLCTQYVVTIRAQRGVKLKKTACNILELWFDILKIELHKNDFLRLNCIKDSVLKNWLYTKLILVQLLSYRKPREYITINFELIICKNTNIWNVGIKCLWRLFCKTEQFFPLYYFLGTSKRKNAKFN